MLAKKTLYPPASAPALSSGLGFVLLVVSGFNVLLNPQD